LRAELIVLTGFAKPVGTLNSQEMLTAEMHARLSGVALYMLAAA